MNQEQKTKSDLIDALEYAEAAEDTAQIIEIRRQLREVEQEELARVKNPVGMV